MELSIRSSKSLLSPALEGYIRRRFTFALDRLKGSIRGIELRLVDTNGPKGGLDKQCSVLVGFNEGEPIRIETRDRDAYQAIDSIAKKLKETLSRRKRMGRRA